MLDLLYNNEETKEKFFEKNKNSDYIKFKKEDFKFFLDENKIDNSYTQFENQIGLFFDNKLLKNRGEVVLNFPFKDCVLEGGQSSDEGEDIYFEFNEKSRSFDEKKGKRKEVFFNEVLGKDEIDRLKEDKVLVNWKRFSPHPNPLQKGEGILVKEEKVGSIKRDENGLIKENLIIKGNNLLALHSLKKEFSGKIKLIYIDPPYNTQTDSFKYNDNFNHSTWLTFMKNRLEVARELLKDDGVIFVNLDDNESHYCKVLMDGIFGRENFLSNIVWHHTVQGKNDSKNFSLQHNQILVFQKSNNFQLGKVERTKEHNINYNNPDNDPRGLWRSGDVRSPSYAKSLIYEITSPNGNIIKSPDFGWRWSKETLDEKIKTGEIIFNKDETKIIRKIYLENQGGRVAETIWLSKDVGTSREGTNEIKNLFDSKIFDTPKPEKLLKRIIEISTNSGDIVLDYHLGSGTTCAVAHKMGRQYIGIEQMDYIETISVERLKKVIEGEQGGISKSVKWEGGGEFIYFELKKWNEEAKEKILNCNKFDELEVFFDEMYNKYFLNYNVKVRDFKEKILKDEKFRKLSLDKQKKMFVSMLDLNQMYVNMSERKDNKFGISDEDVSLSEEFYGLK